MIAEQRAQARTGLLTAAAFAGMFVFGHVMVLLGAVLPALSSRLVFDAAGIGTLFVWMNTAMLACSLVLGFAMDRYGMKPPLVLGPMLAAGALVLIARASRFEDLIPAVMLMGFGGGALNGATNTLVADLHENAQKKSSALNLLGVFFGIGALFMPFAIGALLEKFSITWLLLAASFLCVVAGVYSGALRFPEPKQGHGIPWHEAPRFLKSPLVLAMAALLFFQSGVEFTLGGFMSTYFTRELGMTVGSASYVLAAYWATVIAARVTMSRLVLGADPNRVVMFCAMGACAGTAVAISGNLVLSVIGILVAGFSMAGIFPTMLGIAGSKFPEHSGSVFGILFTCALMGGMTLPWVTGQIAQARGLVWVFVVVSWAFAMITLLSRAVARAGRS